LVITPIDNLSENLKGKMMEIFYIVTLALSGALLCFAGTMRMFKPISSLCLKSYADDPTLQIHGKSDVFSEMRGAGGFTLLSGLAILIGIFMPDFRITSFTVAIVIYLGFTIGRLASLFLDGKPSKSTMQGLMSEVIFSVLNIVCLISL